MLDAAGRKALGHLWCSTLPRVDHLAPAVLRIYSKLEQHLVARSWLPQFRVVPLPTVQLALNVRRLNESPTVLEADDCACVKGALTQHWAIWRERKTHFWFRLVLSLHAAGSGHVCGLQPGPILKKIELHHFPDAERRTTSVAIPDMDHDVTLDAFRHQETPGIFEGLHLAK